MRKIFVILLFCSLMISCMNTDPEVPKKCKCRVQKYEQIVVFKNEYDGTYTGYSDSEWFIKGGLQEDSATDCFKNGKIKVQEFSSSYDSQYRTEIFQKWVYNCK